MNKEERKRWSNANGVSEMIPLGLKRGITRLVNSDYPKLHTIYRDTIWDSEYCEKKAAKIQRPNRRRIQSDTISKSHSYALISTYVEKEIQRISKKHYYRFYEMLLIPDPYRQAPLTAMAIFYTKKPYGVRYTVKGKTEDADYTMTLEPCREHRVPIFGLYGGRKNIIHMELLTPDGTVVAERDLELRTKKLPSKVRNVVSRAQYTEPSAYDMILLSGGLHIHSLAFDCNGDVRWYLSRQTKAYGIFPMANGRFLYTEKWVDVPSYSVSQACMMYEMDYMGRIYKTYLYENGFHHCAREMEAGGNILSGSNSFGGHDENMVIEISRETGEIVDKLVMDDLFDDTYQEWTDWCHVNAVSYNKEDHSVIVSMRNIHTVVKVDWKTKELKWVLAHPDMWKGTNVQDKVLQPVGDVKWIFQQHAAYQQADLDGNPDTVQVLVYDNHWDKRRPVEFYDGDEENSYLSIFNINEKDMTVSMFHTTQCPNSRIRSNAILELEQNRIFNMGGDLVPDIEEKKGIVEEYNYETGELLNRFFVKPGFFTAYPFRPDAQACSQPMELDYDYMWGTTIPLLPYEDELDTANAKQLGLMDEGDEHVSSDEEETTFVKGTFGEDKTEHRENEIAIHFQEDILFVKTMDHRISYIYFVGEHHKYYVDLTGTYQTMDIFRDKIYEIPFWLKEIAADTYHIYYHYKEDLYDSEAEFTIE